jgi:multidrug efflux system membrane fusion protein
MRQRRWMVWVIVLGLAGAGAFLLFERPSEAQRSGAKSQGGRRGAGAGAVPVSVAQAKQGDIGEYISALGTVTPVYTVTVTSRVVGALAAVYYREGQIVHKGQLLALIDPRPYEAVLVQAQGQLIRDQATLANARLDLQRYQVSYQEHAIPEQTFATAQATVNADEGTVKLDQGNLQAAQVNADYTRITSPIDGRVGLRLVDPGNIVQANGTTGLLVITQMQPITVIFTMAEDYLSDVVGQLRAGRKLSVDALDREDQHEIAAGTVLTIDNQVDPTTGTVRVRALFSNRDYRLFPNEFVNAKLLVRMLNNVILVPNAAIQRNNETAYVYLVQANKTVQSCNVNVTTTNSEVSAVTGIKAGDTLVTDGFDRLQNGSHVTVRTAAPAGGAEAPQSSQNATPQRQQGQANQQIPSPTRTAPQTGKK